MTSGLTNFMMPTEYIINYLDKQGQMHSASVKARDPGNAILVFMEKNPKVAKIKSVLPTQQWFNDETNSD